MSKAAKVQDILDNYEDRDKQGWDRTFRFIRVEHSEQVENLMADLLTNGMTSPVVLGEDGRIWDGHKRLCAADTIGLTTVPIVFSEDVYWS